ncbi:MAG TPA: peptidylprolyl isomerase [Gemmataceae bacterium]|jgi:cyclophilin family peptidyl-prolyl cis-trans isomerase
MKRRLLLTTVALGFLVIASCAENTAAPADDKKPVVVVMETSQGTIKIELDAAKAPITVKNFLQYADDKFYDGTIFHRVIENFMIQGGGFKPDLKNAKTEKDAKAAEKTTRDPIKNEGGNGLSNKRGTIAMARTNRLDSATAQFFINVKDNPGLDNPRSPYCVFGKVIEGMDVVDKIKKVKTKTVIEGLIENVPVEDVVIKSVRRADK